MGAIFPEHPHSKTRHQECLNTLGVTDNNQRERPAHPSRVPNGLTECYITKLNILTPEITVIPRFQPSTTEAHLAHDGIIIEVFEGLF